MSRASKSAGRAPAAPREWSAAARTPGTGAASGNSVLIHGARVLDPASGFDRVAQVRVEDGRIASIDPKGAAQRADHQIDARGLWVVPGLVDLSARFREPGQTHKASFASETAAAQAGGIAHVLIPPDTAPVIDTPAMLIRLQRIAQQRGGLHVHALGALTKQLGGEALAELSALRSAGAVGVSNGYAAIPDSRIARRALEYAQGLGLPVHIFAQDAALAAGGCAHEGPVATRLGLGPIPAAAEVAALRFWISLVEDTGARVHFCRLSTARGVQLLESARALKLPVSADVAAHQLHLSDIDVDGFNAQCHVWPPLRSAADRDALRAAVASGLIEAVCSDHQPHEADAKVNPFPLTEPGISALETLLPLTLALAHEGLLTPLQAIARVTSGPAAIAGPALGAAAGRLQPGESADLALIDPDRIWTLHADSMVSAGRNSPFLGKALRGRVVRLLHAGQDVFPLGADRR
ncbi:MAG TPA: dihydroorotase [Fontimonas sp.]